MKMRRIFSIGLSLLLTAVILCSCSFEELFDYYGYPEAAEEGTLAVHFLDIGQGDSIYLELPNAETMLIDAGENYYGEGIIDYIEHTGHDEIDYLVATHPHSDHIGSMSYIVRNFTVNAVYMPKAVTTTKTYQNLLESIQKKGLKITNAKAGMTILSEDGLTVDVIAPVTIDDDLNNCSIVLKITYGDTSFLFTGDAETKEFGAITADMSADVLKVGHHGSRTSTTKEILERIHPDIAVISCGEDNEYGHPHQSTMDLLEQFGCEVYRTDTDGTVTVVSDGETISVETDRISIERAK